MPPAATSPIAAAAMASRPRPTAAGAAWPVGTGCCGTTGGGQDCAGAGCGVVSCAPGSQREPLCGVSFSLTLLLVVTSCPAIVAGWCARRPCRGCGSAVGGRPGDDGRATPGGTTRDERPCHRIAINGTVCVIGLSHDSPALPGRGPDPPFTSFLLCEVLH